MKERHCPVCDEIISGKYCKHCHKFVKPYEVNREAIPQEAMPQMHQKTYAGSSNKSRKSGFSSSHAVALVFCVLVVFGLGGFIAFKLISKEPPETQPIAFSSDEDDEEQVTYESAEVDYQKIVEIGEPSNGYKHFTVKGEDVAAQWLEQIENEFGYSVTYEDQNMDNYEYTDGEYTETYYELYQYYELDDQYQIEVLSDSVTGDLISLWVGCEDIETAKDLFLCGASALAEIQDSYFDETAMLERMDSLESKLVGEATEYQSGVLGDTLVWCYNYEGTRDYYLEANREGASLE